MLGIFLFGGNTYPVLLEYVDFSIPTRKYPIASHSEHDVGLTGLQEASQGVLHCNEIRKIGKILSGLG